MPRKPYVPLTQPAEAPPKPEGMGWEDYAKMLAGMGLRVGGMGLGALAGTAIGGPGVGTAAGGFAGGSAGEALAEKLFDPKHEVNLGKVAVGGVLGAIPGGWMVRAGKPAVSAAIGAGTGYASTAANKMADGVSAADAVNPLSKEWSLPDKLGVVAGGGIGGLFGRFTKPHAATPPPGAPPAPGKPDIRPNIVSDAAKDAALASRKGEIVPSTGARRWPAPPDVFAQNDGKLVGPKAAKEQSMPTTLEQSNVQTDAERIAGTRMKPVTKRMVGRVQKSLGQGQGDTRPSMFQRGAIPAVEKVEREAGEGPRFASTDPGVDAYTEDFLGQGNAPPRDTVLVSESPEVPSEATQAALTKTGNKTMGKTQLSRVRSGAAQAARQETAADLANTRVSEGGVDLDKINQNQAAEDIKLKMELERAQAERTAQAEAERQAGELERLKETLTQENDPYAIYESIAGPGEHGGKARATFRRNAPPPPEEDGLGGGSPTGGGPKTPPDPDGTFHTTSGKAKQAIINSGNPEGYRLTKTKNGGLFKVEKIVEDPANVLDDLSLDAPAQPPVEAQSQAAEAQAAPVAEAQAQVPVEEPPAQPFEPGAEQESSAIMSALSHQDPDFAGLDDATFGGMQPPTPPVEPPPPAPAPVLAPKKPKGGGGASGLRVAKVKTKGAQNVIARDAEGNELGPHGAPKNAAELIAARHAEEDANRAAQDALASKLAEAQAAAPVEPIAQAPVEDPNKGFSVETRDGIHYVKKGNVTFGTVSHPDGLQKAIANIEKFDGPNVNYEPSATPPPSDTPTPPIEAQAPVEPVVEPKPERAYKGDAGQFFTLADEQAGYPKTKEALAGYDNERLRNEHNESVKDSFNKVFGHNAKKFLKLVEDEMNTRGIKLRPTVTEALEEQARNHAARPKPPVEPVVKAPEVGEELATKLAAKKAGKSAKTPTPVVPDVESKVYLINPSVSPAHVQKQILDHLEKEAVTAQALDEARGTTYTEKGGKIVYPPQPKMLKVSIPGGMEMRIRQTEQDIRAVMERIRKSPASTFEGLAGVKTKRPSTDALIKQTVVPSATWGTAEKYFPELGATHDELARETLEAYGKRVVPKLINQAKAEYTPEQLYQKLVEKGKREPLVDGQNPSTIPQAPEPKVEAPVAKEEYLPDPNRSATENGGAVVMASSKPPVEAPTVAPGERVIPAVENDGQWAPARTAQEAGDEYGRIKEAIAQGKFVPDEVRQAAASEAADLARAEQATSKGALKIKGQKGFIGAMPMMRLASGAAGAAVGAAQTPDEPWKGAIIGGAAGALAPGAIKALINQVSKNPSATVQQKTAVADTVKEKLVEFGRMLPEWQRFALLADHINLPINVLVGPYGSAMMGAIEHAIQGDPRGMVAIKMLLNPKEFGPGVWKGAMTEAKLKVASAAERTEGQMGKAGPKWFRDMTKVPGDFMVAGDITARNILTSAGFSPEEARAITLTADPKTGWGQGIAKLKKGAQTEGGKKSIAVNLALPFYRTTVNQIERSMERTPILGIFAQKWKDNPDPKAAQIAQQTFGSGVGATSFILGYMTGDMDPTHPMMKTGRKFLNEVTGQYGTLASLAFTAGQAYRKKGTFVGAGQAVVGRLANGDLPLPTAQPLQDIAGTIKGITGDGPMNIPAGVLPGIISPKRPGSVLNLLDSFITKEQPKGARPTAPARTTFENGTERPAYKPLSRPK